MKTSDLRHRQDVPVITADQRGYITSVNAQFETTYGWSEADLLGKPLPTIIPPRFHDAQEQVPTLLAASVISGQGYFLARPMPAAAIAPLLRSGLRLASVVGRTSPAQAQGGTDSTAT